MLGSMLANTSYDVWIGITDKEVEGNWVWTDSSPTDYVNWGEGMPDGHCGAIWPSSCIEWETGSCDTGQAYHVCKYMR